MVVPYFPMPVWGGMEKQAYILAKSLAEDGHKIIVMARRFSAEQKSIEQTNGIEVIRLSFGSGLLKLFDGVYQLMIPFMLFSRRKEFDIVHVHTIRIAGLISLVVAKLLGKKTLQKIPSVGIYGIFEPLQSFSGWLRKRIFKLSADSIVSLSKKSVQELKSYGYPETRILKITNGVEAAKEVKGTIGEQELLKIVFLGRLVPKKGIFDLLEAWKIVVSDNSERLLELGIFGQGPLKSIIQKNIYDNILTTTARVYGHTDDVQSILSSADIMVLPSYEEGNSNSVLEAMATGVPIVSTKVGGTPNLVGEIGSHFLYEPGDVTKLSEILLQLIKNKKLRTELGVKMRERALKHFSISDIKDKYVLAYKLLLEEKEGSIWNCSDYPPA